MDPNHANFDVMPDDRRLVMLRWIETERGELIWVEHWLDELAALVGTR